MTVFLLLAVAMLALVFIGIAPALIRPQVAPSDTDDQGHSEQNLLIARERMSLLAGDLQQGLIDAHDFEITKRELEQTLLQEMKMTTNTRYRQGGFGKITLIVLLVAVPLASALLYRNLGSPEAVQEPVFVPNAPVMTHTSQPSAANSNNAMAGSMAELAVRLRQRLEEQTPEDIKGWFLLGRTYMEEKDLANAVYAYEKAYALAPSDPTIKQALDDARSMSAGAMRGMSAAAAPSASAEQPATKPATQMTLQIGISDALAAKANSNDALFVYVKAVNGPRFPLAAKRLTVRDLPLTITLTDADAMMPAAKMSDFGEYLVGARISPSGNAITQPGDFYGELQTGPTANPVTIQIDKVKP
ncbi:MAG: c-type cytochrome biogenesis protein CcmI [Thalassolituus sp.]|jgi:cytochrome c-type biogenesis protein CcmI|uniref:c-type cytochrome biogenesis protein CcmI n=1 Tax=Thalassolituus sp. TaxID=2030822 RepID=UPI003981A100